MRYRGFNFTYSIDRSVERENPVTHQLETRNGYYCEIYPGDDDLFANRIDSFCLADGYEIPEWSDYEAEKAIRDYIDSEYLPLKEECSKIKSDRRKDLVGRLVSYIGETLNGYDLYDTLTDFCHMTDDEIREAGFLSLVPYFNKEGYAQTIAEYLIDYGTDHSLSGNYHIEFSEINERFGVSLPDDTEMLDYIVDALDRDIVSDIEVSEDFDMMFYTNYCPNYEGETYEME